jgi:hypothetical protein
MILLLASVSLLETDGHPRIQLMLFTDHEAMVGVEKVEAGSDLITAKMKKKPHVEKGYEEWNGIEP